MTSASPSSASLLAPTLMVQGTASSVGKSLIVAALCRYFHRQGLRVAPFKSQNMSLNAAVTADGYEIGRAQAVQARACGVPARVEMNPILLKPESQRGAQVVVMGRSLGSMNADSYHEHRTRLRGTIEQCLHTLRVDNDLVIIEGAGSPAEINLQSRDIVNMFVADLADAPVLLVGDIDRGGVFAALVGTLALLSPEHQQRVAGFVVNKFRGERALLQPGLDMLHERTGKPVLGVVPYVSRLRIADEDSLSLEARVLPTAYDVTIAVIRLPRISNYDDVEALEHEPGVRVQFVEEPSELRRADLVIVPGSKSTVSDLQWMRERGWDRFLIERVAREKPVLGICGGCQILGRRIDDPHGVESDEASVEGLGLLPVRTRFATTKTTASVVAYPNAPCWLTRGLESGSTCAGYELHMGQLEPIDDYPQAPFRIVARNGEAASVLDGAVGGTGVCVGTMIHGLLEDDAIRGAMLDYLRARRGLAPRGIEHSVPTLDLELDRFADVIAASIDQAAVWRLLGQKSCRPLAAGSRGGPQPKA